LKLSGKVAIVTGAGGGIGRSAALSLAKRGVALVLVGRSREKLAQTALLVEARAGGFAEMVAGDVTDEAVRGAAIETARRRFGRLDILVNNAGNVRAGRLDKIEGSEIRSPPPLALRYGVDVDSTPLARAHGVALVRTLALKFCIGFIRSRAARDVGLA
jgi:uncharacterized oxidoreductase